MNTKTFGLLIFFIIFYQQFILRGQDIEIKQIDNTKFPVIKIIVAIPVNAEVNENNFNISENGQKKDFVLDTSNFEQIPFDKSIIYMMENTPANFSLKSYIANSIDFLDSADFFNIVFAGNNKHEDIQLLSIEFTRKKNLLKRMLKNYPAQGSDTLSYFPNLYINILDIINLTNQESLIPSEKSIIIIGEFGKQKIERKGFTECLNQLINNQIPVYIIATDSVQQSVYDELAEISKKSGGEITISTHKGCQEILNQFIKKINIKNLVQNKTYYQIQYKTTQNKQRNIVEIEYNKQKYLRAFGLPANNRQHTHFYVWINILFVVLLFFAAITIYWFNRKKIIALLNRQENIKFKQIIRENGELRKELENYKKNSVIKIPEFKKFNPKIPLLGGANKIPVLMVESAQISDSFELTKLLMTIGRDTKCDIVIIDSTISAQHATISNEGGEFYITDNNSTNGTFVNDLRIKKSKITNTDVIRMGAVFVKLQS